MMIVRIARTWRSVHIPQTLNPLPRACSRDFPNSARPYHCSLKHAYHSGASKIQVPNRGGSGRISLLFPAVLAGWFGIGGLQVACADDDDEKEVESYTITDTNKVVKAGDSVLMQLFRHQYLARIEKIEADDQNNAKVRVRRYYRPEESIGGRRVFHGSKELFLSDHYDIQSANTIKSKYVVHFLQNYRKLENVGDEDNYCRFQYNTATGAFTPDMVAVFCKCEMPRNPDDFMLQCRDCLDWFHPACENMSTEAAKQLEHFICSLCSAEGDVETYPRVLHPLQQ